MKAMLFAYARLESLDADPAGCKRAFMTSIAQGAEWGPPMIAIFDLRITQPEGRAGRS